MQQTNTSQTVNRGQKDLKLVSYQVFWQPSHKNRGKLQKLSNMAQFIGSKYFSIIFPESVYAILNSTGISRKECLILAVVNIGCTQMKGHCVIILYPGLTGFSCQLAKTFNFCVLPRWRARWCITSPSHRSHLSISCTKEY